MKKIEEIRKEVEKRTGRSAWSKGVTEYAGDLLDKLEELMRGGYVSEDVFENLKALEKAMLNGAGNWEDFSWGGSSLIYDCDIAERLCCPSELKKTRGGERRPNGTEDWLDVQARALFQACSRIKRAAAAIR